ncbi:MAG TPA: OmpA family protein [Bacillota bacterium]|nr:OmpA family protein [Bacillota bacterium]
MKMLARVVILFFIMLVVGACSSSETSNDSEEESKAENESEASEEETSENNQTHENKYEGELGDYEVYITGEMREEDDKIIIEGESNLLPGSKLIGEVSISTDTEGYRYSSDFQEYEYQADTREVVADDGSFTMTIDHHGEKDKETHVSVRFDLFENQEDEVRRHYGDNGENMEGPYIYKYRDEEGNTMPRYIFNRAEVVTSFTPSDDEVIRQFKEPTLGDIPDDQGDPNVWIEVDEYNDDGDYYYVRGKSNLIEGSMVSLTLDNTRHTVSRTLIDQDGTFSFKFPYDPEERPEKMIFAPFDYQWNVIEETYGSYGQKLAGDLATGRAHDEDEKYIMYELTDDSKEIDVPDNVELDIDGSDVTMLVPDDVLFDYDKYELKSDAKGTLDDIAKVLDESFNQKDLDIEIAGHTDNEGSTEYNMDLSEDRAKSVKDYLEKQIKNNEMTFETKGYADKKPTASNDTEEGQAKNRRVEVIVKLK